MTSSSAASRISSGKETTEALLVSIGASRLRSSGIEIPSTIASPEHKLYLLLAKEMGNAALNLNVELAAPSDFEELFR